MSRTTTGPSQHASQLAGLFSVAHNGSTVKTTDFVTAGSGIDMGAKVASAVSKSETIANGQQAIAGLQAIVEETRPEPANTPAEASFASPFDALKGGIIGTTADIALTMAGIGPAGGVVAAVGMVSSGLDALRATFGQGFGGYRSDEKMWEIRADNDDSSVFDASPSLSADLMNAPMAMGFSRADLEFDSYADYYDDAQHAQMELTVNKLSAATTGAKKRSFEEISNLETALHQPADREMHPTPEFVNNFKPNAPAPAFA